jgi:RNA polymerase sigma-70 factor, ECF subfamily
MGVARVPDRDGLFHLRSDALSPHSILDIIPECDPFGVRHTYKRLKGLEMSLWRVIVAGLAYSVMQVALRFKDDGDLVRRLKARDPHVMSKLYDRYGRLVYSIIFRVVRDAASAEDLVQETFLRIWNRAQSFDQQRGALGPWILTVARNRAIDHLRSIDGRMAAGALELDRIENPAQFASIEDRALTMDRARKIKEAFQKLAPHQKEVIELAYYQGLSQTEMAERLKQPLGTVKTWVRTALQVLREELSGAAVA